MPTTSPGNNKPPEKLFPPSGKVEADLPKNNTKRMGVWAALGGTVAVTSAALAFVSGGLGIPLLVGAVGAVAGYAFVRRGHEKALEKYDVTTASSSVNVSQPTSPTGSLLDHPSIRMDFSPKYPAEDYVPSSVPANLKSAISALQNEMPNWSSEVARGKRTDLVLNIKHLMEKIDELPLEDRIERLQSIKEYFQAQSQSLDERNTKIDQDPIQVLSDNEFIDILSQHLDIQVSNVNAELALREEIKHHRAFEGFPTKELWRLVISGQDHGTKGKYGYEDSPGYLAGCFNMLTCMLKHRREGKPLNRDFLIELHDVAARYTHASCNLVKTFRQGICGNHFSLIPGMNLSEAGWKEIKEDMHCQSELLHKLTESEPSTTIPVLLTSGYSRILMTLRQNYGTWMGGKEATYNASFLCEFNPSEGYDVESEDLKEDIQTLIDKCYAALKQAETQEEKEKEITFHMAQIKRMQPFATANLSTIAFGAINLLRLEQGLLPLIWENPSQLDGFSSDELVKIQQESAARFKSFKTAAVDS